MTGIRDQTTSARPVRLRLSRRKGFDLQAASRAVNGLPAVRVDRATALGNPFVVGRDGTAADCVRQHRFLLAGLLCLTRTPTVEEQRAYRDTVAANRDNLRGKNLACWCRLDKPCHADTLLALANQDEELQ